MDVIRELPWTRWGRMAVREIRGESGPLKIITPEHGRQRCSGYDVFREKRSLLDDLLHAAASDEHSAMQRSAIGAGEQLGKQRFDNPGAIQERDIVTAASRWGFLRPEVCVDEGRRVFEPLDLWKIELLHLRQACDLFETGGRLSS